MSDVAPLDWAGAEELPTPQGVACEACGAPLEAHDKFCASCGTAHEVSAPGPTATAQKSLRCQTCGAEVSMDLDHRSFTCPFCDSNYVVEFTPEQSGRQPPEFVIGFAVTPEQAQAKFAEWLKQGNLFRPGDLARAQPQDKLRGVYLPFWMFSMLAESEWSARIGEHWMRTETYTAIENGKPVTRTRQVQETEWWPLAGRHHEYYSGFLVSGSRGLPQRDAERIKPFQLPAIQRYERYFLAGWLCEEYSIEREQALAICQQEFSRREQSAVAAFLPGDTHSGLSVATRFDQVNSDLTLAPVYILSYKYREKIYRFLVNGQTGKFAGDKPVSFKRIIAAIVLILGGLALVAAAVALLGRGT